MQKKRGDTHKSIASCKTYVATRGLTRYRAPTVPRVEHTHMLTMCCHNVSTVPPLRVASRCSAHSSTFRIQIASLTRISRAVFPNRCTINRTSYRHCRTQSAWSASASLREVNTCSSRLPSLRVHVTRYCSCIVLSFRIREWAERTILSARYC